MCNQANCSHTDLDDSIDDLFGGPGVKAPVPTYKQVATVLQAEVHQENCPACRGSGQFRSYTGRIVGQCFKCKGSGKLVFKTDRATREKSRQYAATRRDKQAAAVAEYVATWAETNQEDYQWIQSRRDSFEFAASLWQTLNKYGQLSERQHATVTRLRVADAEKAAARKSEAEARAANAQSVSIQPIIDSFATARENGIKRPKIRLGGFKFSLAPLSGINAGAIYVTDIGTEQYLGKIANNKFFAQRACTAEQEAQVVEVSSDPKAAAIAYGQRTGSCSCCGRELTNHASIDLGIGPICAEKYGW